MFPLHPFPEVDLAFKFLWEDQLTSTFPDVRLLFNAESLIFASRELNMGRREMGFLDRLGYMKKERYEEAVSGLRLTIGTLEAKSTDLEKERDELKRITDALQGEVSAFESERGGLSNRIGELEAVNIHLAKERDELKSRVEMLQNKLSDLEEQRDDQRKRFGELEGKVSSLEKERDAKDNRIGELEAAATHLGKEREGLTSTVKTLESRLSELLKEREEIEARSADSGGERERLIDRIRELEMKSANIGEENDKLKSTIDMLQGKVLDLEEQRRTDDKLVKGACSAVRRIRYSDFESAWDAVFGSTFTPWKQDVRELLTLYLKMLREKIGIPD